MQLGVFASQIPAIAQSGLVDIREPLIRRSWAGARFYMNILYSLDLQVCKQPTAKSFLCLSLSAPTLGT
jgi:hypothetical protein